MSSKKDIEKMASAAILFSVTLLAFNLYRFGYSFWVSAGLDNVLSDLLLEDFSSTGLLKSPYVSKLLILAVMTPIMLVDNYASTEVSRARGFLILAAGAVCYLFPAGEGLPYVLSTVSGLSCILIGEHLVGLRKKEVLNDDRETFEQCSRLMYTEDSINLPTRYQYRHEMHKGWINVVNPFRATMVLGNPGSGKSYSVIEPYIEQMMSKGYAMFVYDFKFPTLSNVVYNEMLMNRDKFAVAPEFCLINFDDPRYSMRCNPLNPKFITTPFDAIQIAEEIMSSLNRGKNQKDDFFYQSSKNYLSSVIWFLRSYEKGRYCTFPHVIELMSLDYERIFVLLSGFPEIMARIKPFINAMEGGAQDQLQGQIGSSQVPLSQFSSKELYWVLTGDDFDLDINSPEHPKILCAANNPKRMEAYGVSLALFTNRMIRRINQAGRVKCGVLLDELPTIYLKGLDHLIATARSNKVAVVLGAQDFSQLRRDYGKDESDVIINTVSNIFFGQVFGPTAESLSRMFGKEKRQSESQTHGQDSDSVNLSMKDEDVLSVRKIQSLSQGIIAGKVADNNGMENAHPFFCAEVQRPYGKVKERRRHWKPIPQLTDFGEGEIRSEVMGDPDRFLAEFLVPEVCKLGYREGTDAFRENLDAKVSGLSRKRRMEILEQVVNRKISVHIDRILTENFLRVQQEVASILEQAGCSPSAGEDRTGGQGRKTGTDSRNRLVGTDAKPPKEEECDPRVIQPFEGM